MPQLGILVIAIFVSSLVVVYLGVVGCIVAVKMTLLVVELCFKGVSTSTPDHSNELVNLRCYAMSQ